MAESLCNNRARLRRQRWSTLNLITNPEEDGCRLYVGGFCVVCTYDMMDNFDIQRIANYTHQNCG